MANNSEKNETYSFVEEFEIASSNQECTSSLLNYFQKRLVDIIQSSNFGDFGNCFSKYFDYIMNIVSDDRITHKEQFEICEESFRIVKDAIFGDKSLSKKFVKGLIEKIFNIVIEENPRIWIVKKEILKILNNCQQILKKTEKTEILQTLPQFYMFKLMDTLSTLSDYEFQVHLIEAMFRIYGKKAINLRLKDIIPESEELSQIFGEINPGTFDEDVRSFLNILNRSHNTIYSVLAQNISMDNFLCQYPMDSIAGIWVDFNLSDRIISWSSIQESFMEECSENDVALPWVFISLMSNDVENYKIISTEGQQLVIVSFKLKSPCICSNEEVRDKVDKIKNIKFLFKDSPQLHHIIADIFPLWFPLESTRRVETKFVSEQNDPFENSNQIKLPKSRKAGLNETGVLSGVIEPASVKSQTTRSSNSLNDSRCKVQSTSHETDQCEEVISLYSSLSSELSAAERDIENIKILSGRSAETSASFFQQNNRISSGSDVRVSREATSSQEFHTAENINSEVFHTALRSLKDSSENKRSKNIHSMSKISSKELVSPENIQSIAKEMSTDVVKSSISIPLNEVHEIKQREKNEEQLNKLTQSSVLVKNKDSEYEEKTQEILASAIIVLSDDENEKISSKRIVEQAQHTVNENEAPIADRKENKHVAKSSTSIRNEPDKKKGDSKYSFDKKKDNQEVGTANKRFVCSTNKISEDASHHKKMSSIMDQTKAGQPNNEISFTYQSKRLHSKKEEENNREIILEDSEKENQKECIKSSTSRKTVDESELEKFTIKKKKLVKRLLNARKRIISRDDSTDDEATKEECHKIVNISTLRNRKQKEPHLQEERCRESKDSADLNDINTYNKNPNKTNEFPESSEDPVKSSKSADKGKEIEMNIAAENKETQSSKTCDETTRNENAKIVILSDIKFKPNERLEPKSVDGIESSEKSSSSNSQPHFVGSEDTGKQHGEIEVEKQASQVEKNHNKLLKLLDGEDTSDEEIFSICNTLSQLQRKRLTKISEISDEARFEDESKKSVQVPKAEVTFKELIIPLQRCYLQSSKSFGGLPVPITQEVIVSPDIFEDDNLENLNAKESQKSETVSQIEKEIQTFGQKSKQEKLIQDKTEINSFENQESDADSDNYTFDGNFPLNSESGPKPIINPETAFDELTKEDVSKKTVNNHEHENQIIVTKETELNQHQPGRTEKVPDKEIKEVTHVEDLKKKNDKKLRTKSDISQKDQKIAIDEIEEGTNQGFDTKQKNYENKKVPGKEIKEVTHVEDLKKKNDKKLRTKSDISQKDQKIAIDEIEEVTDQGFDTKQKNYENAKLPAKEIKEVTHVEDLKKKNDKKLRTKSDISQKDQNIAIDETEEVTDQGFDTKQKNYENKKVPAKEIKEVTHVKDLKKKNDKKLRTKSDISQKDQKIAIDEIEEVTDQGFDTKQKNYENKKVPAKEIKEVTHVEDLKKKNYKKLRTKSDISQNDQKIVIDETEEVTDQDFDTKQKNYENKKVPAKEIKEVTHVEDLKKKNDKKLRTKSDISQKDQKIAIDEIEEGTDQGFDTKQKNYENRKVPAKEIKEVTHVEDLKKKNDKKLRTKSDISQKDQKIAIDEIEEVTDQDFDTKQKNYENKKVPAKEINEVPYGEDVPQKNNKKLKKNAQISQQSNDQITPMDEFKEVTDRAFETKQKQCTTDEPKDHRVEVKEKETKTNINDRIEEITIETLEDGKKCREDHDIEDLDENGNISQRTWVDPRGKLKENQVVVQALVHETSKLSKKVVTFDQTTNNEEQKTAENDGLDLWKKTDLNQSLISNRSGRRKRLLYDPNLPVDEFVSNNTSIQNKSLTTASKHNKTVSNSSKFDEISVADQNNKETESIFVEQTDQNDKEVESILSTQKQNEDEAVHSEIVTIDDTIEKRRQARSNTNKNKNYSKPERLFTETIRKTKVIKKNNIVSTSYRFDNNQKKRSDLKSAFEDMLESFRSELGGRTLLEEMEMKKLQMSTSLFESRKKEKTYKYKKPYRITKRNCLVTLGTPTLSKRKENGSESSDKSVHGESKKEKAKSLRKSNRISNKNVDRSVEIDFRRLNGANRHKRLLESTRFDEIESNFNVLDENTLELSPNKKRKLGDAEEDLGSFWVTVSGPAPSWHGMAVENENFVTIKSEDFSGKYLILFFYPSDFGFLPNVQGPKEVLVFNEKFDEFKALNCEVVVCSVDSHYVHLNWIKSGKEEKNFKQMKVTLLSDANHAISKAYGVYMPRWGYTLRSLFIINTNGIIQMQTITDVTFEIDVDKVLQQLQKLQNIEENR